MSRQSRATRRSEDRRRTETRALVDELKRAGTIAPFTEPLDIRRDCEGPTAEGCAARPEQVAVLTLQRDGPAYLCLYCLSLVLAEHLAHLERLREHHLHLH